MTDAAFLLLQINDTAFPIGAFTHSFGLETYIAKGLVANADQARSYLEQNLHLSFLTAELLPAKLAWEYASDKDMDALIELEQTLYAARIARELREAAAKLGRRFAKTVAHLSGEAGFFAHYVRACGALVSRPVAYGVFCASRAVGLDAALATYLYAQTSGQVTTCVKTIPLSQNDGQRILDRLRGIFRQLLEEVNTLGPDDLMRSCPGLELRAMQHESLYSRMYIS